MKRSELRRTTPMRRSGPPNRKPMRRRKASRGSTAPEFGQAFWQVQREALYARAGGRCELGGCSLDEHGMEAHHRRRRSQGHDHGLHNLAALCPTHHRWVHAHPAAARAKGFLVRRTQDPAAMPVQLHGGRVVLLAETYLPYDNEIGDAS